MPIDLRTSADFEAGCLALNTGPGELCVTFPGGATICAQYGYDLGDPSEITKSLLASLNSALAPLVPFLNVLDVIKAIFDCIQAIPDALGPPPDPSGIIACMPALVEKVNKLLELIPPFPIFKLVKGILEVIIQGLLGFKMKVLAIVAQQQRILQAGLAAAELGNIALKVVVDCATGNMDAYLENLNAELQPLNRLMGLINVLLKLVQVDCVPMLEGLTELAEEALEPLDVAIEILAAIRDAIPGPFQLGPLPPPGENDC